eukprot:GHVO01045566.1.p1 GENE.GHVO01045566.1~~GHVO01045566.1.p1  ORF type:complete len:301 (+),score=36.83 GHVO01045566.1:39-941(+)
MPRYNYYESDESEIEDYSDEYGGYPINVLTNGSCFENDDGELEAEFDVYFGVDDFRNTSGPVSGPQSPSRAELFAILEALKVMRDSDGTLVIHTRSVNSVNCVTKWYKQWQSNGWQTRKGAVLNQDIIRRVRRLMDERQSNGNDVIFNTDCIHIFTDGSCRFNGHSGRATAGWGVFFDDDDHRNSSGVVPGLQTNQRAELFAILMALLIMKEEDGVLVIHTDSIYSIRCLTCWYDKWESRDWQTSMNESVKNQELIKTARALVDARGGVGEGVIFRKVQAHSSDYGNYKADSMARDETFR